MMRSTENQWRTLAGRTSVEGSVARRQHDLAELNPLLDLLAETLVVRLRQQGREANSMDDAPTGQNGSSK